MKSWTAHDDDWEREANQMARDLAPAILPCRKCDGPYVDGYVCPHCGDDGCDDE